MATPQERLPDLSTFADPLPSSSPSGVRPREPKPRAVKATTSAAGLPSLDEFADSPPAAAPAAPKAPAAPADDLPDLSAFAEPGEAQPARDSGIRPRSSPRSYGAHEVFQPSGAAWTIERAAPVKQFFRDTFGRDLPVKAFGQSKTHNSMGLDHSRSMDVPLHPQSPEGKRLAEYLRANNIPFLAYNHRVAGASTGAHFHIGHPSHRIGAGGVSPVADSPDFPDLSEFADAPDETEPLDRTRFDAATPDALRRRGTREEIARFTSQMSPHLDALGVKRVEFEDNEAGAGDEVERVNSVPATVAVAPNGVRARAPKSLDPYSAEDRARRDAAASARVRSVSVPLTRSLADYRDSAELMADAYREGARSLNIDPAFVEEWLKSHADDLRLINSATGEPHTPADLQGSPVHDEQARTVRLNLGGLADLERDWKAHRSTASRVADFVTDDTTTAGEKFLDVAAPAASAAGRAADLATRPLQAGSTALWSLARHYEPSKGMLGVDATQAASDAWHEFRTGETPEGAGNWLAERARRSERLRAVNPNLPALVGGVVEMVTDPANAVPLGIVARGAGALRGLKTVRRIEQALLASRDARFVEFYNAGGRILKIEAAPLEEIAAAAGDAPHFKMTLRDADGAEHVIDTSAFHADGQKPKLYVRRAGEDIQGKGLERDGDSGRIFLNGKPQDFRMESDGSLVASPVGGHGKAAQVYKADQVSAMLPDLAELGSYVLRSGEKDFDSFAAAMVDELGEGIKPHLRKIYAEAQKQADVAGKGAASEWQQFAPESGTLNVPRSSMPQIKSEHRGALVQYLKGRGIAHEQVEIAPNTLKPSQAEYSPEKVNKARGFEGTPRSILVSADGHVLDGHHQWLSSLEDAPDVPIPAIRLDAPINQLLIETARFPSSGVDAASGAARAVGSAATDSIPVNPNPSPRRLGAAMARVAPNGITSRVLKGARKLANVVNITKAAPASFDSSVLFNQGSMIIGSHPSLLPDAVKKGVKAAVSKESFETFKKELATSPRQPLREMGGLDLVSLRGATEEQFGSDLAKRIPGIAASERQAAATMDSLRADAYDWLADDLVAAGVDPAADPKSFKDVGKYINAASGRAHMGVLEPLAEVLNLPLFSPRLLYSRVQVLNPVFYARMSPAARRLALRETFRSAGSLGVVMGLSKLAGLDVDLDPFSGGFGTIQSGETSYSLDGGRLRPLKFAFQMADSLAREARGESLKESRKPAALLEKFWRAYLSPVGQLAADWKTGENFDGSEFRGDWRELDRLMPFAVKDVRDAYLAAGPKGAVKAAPAFVGVGVHTRERRPEPIKPALAEPIKRELERLQLDLDHLGKDGKKDANVSPDYKVEGITGDQIAPFGDDTGKRPASGMHMDAQAVAAPYSEELNEVLGELLNSPDYEAFGDDAARRKYVEMIILNTKKRYMNGARVDARALELEKEKKVEDRLKRMGAESKGKTHFRL